MDDIVRQNRCRNSVARFTNWNTFKLAASRVAITNPFGRHRLSGAQDGPANDATMVQYPTLLWQIALKVGGVGRCHSIGIAAVVAQFILHLPKRLLADPARFDHGGELLDGRIGGQFRR
ncbi:hypothetical protein [Methylobacterium bullatum]|uniref:hypothetical protein n=1 Tax=Methylobacterium bullatum TaxID=570505 RepID=UPI00177F67C6|nr:hypothetical protein [Methylobacterium bullatum]